MIGTLAPTEMPKTYTNQVIRASAGTGKTYHLSNRFLQLILDGQPIDRVLATTFTRQAAREILDRILLRLARAAECERACRELAHAIDRPELRTETCLEVLRYLTSNLHRVRVSTLDAFFVRIAQSYALELGLPPGWQIVEETDEARMRDRAIQQLISNDKPKRVVELMHLLTKGEARRSVSELIRATVTELHDLYIESAPRAWQRLTKLRDLDDHSVQAAMDILDSYGDLPKKLQKAISHDVANLKQADWGAFAQKGIAPKVLSNETRYSGIDIPEEIVEVYRVLIAQATAAIRKTIIAQTESRYELLGRFDEIYQKQKLDSRGFRFVDVTRAILANSSKSSFDQIAFRLNSSIDHLLLDEFQDTSLEQWRVIAPYAHRTTDDEANRSFFCVGDAKQAIYGWRGGDSEILDSVNQQLEHVEQTELTKSYRSSVVIIDFVNDINFGFGNHNHLSENQAETIKRWSQRFPKHETAVDLPGYVTIETSPPVEENCGRDQKQIVLEFTAQRVREVHSDTPDASIAVLTRTNASVAETIFYLQQKGIPASEVGGNPLTDSAAVQLILSLLQLADHPGDRVAAFHLANSPWSETLKIENEVRSAYRLSSRVRRVVNDMGIGKSVDCWSKQLRPFCNLREWRRLRQLAELAYNFQRRIETPFQIGYSAQRRIGLTNQEFIQLVRTKRVADPSSNQVVVMTVHQAKGLQFDVVFITELDRRFTGQTPDCVSQRPSPFQPIDRVSRYVNKKHLPLFPLEVKQLHKSYEQAKLHEELCVFYVGLTRAIHALHLIIQPNTLKQKSEVKERNLPKSPSGLLCGSVRCFHALPPQSIIYESGNPRWFESIRRLPPQSSSRRNTVPSSALRLRESSGRKLLEGLSPSQREGWGKVRLGDKLNLQTTGAMQYGTVIHGWMEQIEWLDKEPLDADLLFHIAKKLGLPESRIDETWNQFQNMLQQPETKSVLVETDYRNSERIQRWQLDDLGLVQVRNEQPISAILADGAVTGFVDRLIVFHDESGVPIAADVLDFKTDTIDPANGITLRSKVEHYRPQIKAYKIAITQMLRIPADKVAAALIFVGLGKVVDVAS